MSTTPRKFRLRQRGVGIIAALFVVIVIAGLAITLTRITARQSASVAVDDRGVRAYWAARAGVDWASYQITHSNPSCSGAPTSLPGGATSLSEFSLSIACTGSGPYTITATATAGAGPTYVRRIITRTMQ